MLRGLAGSDDLDLLCFGAMKPRLPTPAFPPDGYCASPGPQDPKGAKSICKRCGQENLLCCPLSGACSAYKLPSGCYQEKDVLMCRVCGGEGQPCCKQDQICRGEITGSPMESPKCVDGTCARGSSAPPAAGQITPGSPKTTPPTTPPPPANGQKKPNDKRTKSPKMSSRKQPRKGAKKRSKKDAKKPRKVKPRRKHSKAKAPPRMSKPKRSPPPRKSTKSL
jgi:hypothetical protein